LKNIINRKIIMRIIIILAITIAIALFGFCIYFSNNLTLALKLSVGDEILKYVEEPEGKVNFLYGRPYCHIKARVKPEYEDTIIEILKNKYAIGKKIVPKYSSFEYISELNENELTYRFVKQRSGKYVRCKEATIYVTRKSDGYMYLYIEADLFFNR